MKRMIKAIFATSGAVAIMLICLFAKPLSVQAAFEAPYYNITMNGGEFDGNQYVVNGQVIKNAFFCDGTYTYFLQYDGTPMKNRLTYHPDGEHVIYFDSEGHEVFSDFTNVKQAINGDPVDDLCFFDVYGYMYVDVLTYDKEGKNLYYANPFGVMERNGWFTFSDGGKGFANSDGTLLVNTYTKTSDGLFYFLNGMGHVYGYKKSLDGEMIPVNPTDPVAETPAAPAAPSNPATCSHTFSSTLILSVGSAVPVGTGQYEQVIVGYSGGDPIYDTNPDSPTFGNCIGTTPSEPIYETREVTIMKNKATNTYNDVCTKCGYSTTRTEEVIQ